MSNHPDPLTAINAAFGNTPRPEHFTNFTHCEECAEHDETLLAHTPETITMEELGNPGWDPICFVDTQGYHYYMSGLARLALGTNEEFYLDQFLFHLAPDRIEAFNREQHDAVLLLLEYIRDTMADSVGSSLETKTLERRIRRMRNTVETRGDVS